MTIVPRSLTNVLFVVGCVRAEGKLEESERQLALLKQEHEVGARSEAEARRLTDSLSEKSRGLKDERRALTEERER